eukprot:TRINITY_DN2291_c0_g1_i1.p1 TRINITY_DN2291_c0_g1~~TRINITY_DN2291_c0_g1_i1.p1  ORF type:complete len:119 (+),score=23.39 TRINITY_DN2291_c0_g1_i1:226-582(+)
MRQTFNPHLSLPNAFLNLALTSISPAQSVPSLNLDKEKDRQESAVDPLEAPFDLSCAEALEIPYATCSAPGKDVKQLPPNRRRQSTLPQGNPTRAQRRSTLSTRQHGIRRHSHGVLGE